jgi:hypothetical protein
MRTGEQNENRKGCNIVDGAIELCEDAARALLETVR